MGAPKGNKFWMLGNPGAKKKFETPAALMEAALEYLEWNEQNPLNEEKAFCSGGDILIAKVKKLRAPTIIGFCNHFGITQRTWGNYLNREEYKETCEIVYNLIYQQKFEGAAAGLFCPTIIARDLGLVDKREDAGNLTVIINKTDLECL